jgi:hypothetical protein
VDSGEMFDNLNKDIAEYPNHGKIILLGDFNCRTGEQADHIINDTLFNRADNNIPSKYVQFPKESPKNLPLRIPNLVLMQVSNKSFPRELIVLSQFFLIISLSQVETSSHCIIRMAFNINTPIGNHDNEYLYIYLYSHTAKYNGEEKNNNMIIT